MTIVSSLHTYPIKSCRGVDLEYGIVERRGFRHDRRFMVVDADGSFLSQRSHPDLARVEVLLEGEDLLVATVDELGEVHIELDAAGEGPALEATLRSYVGPAIDQGDECAEFFSDLLGDPARLVYMAEDTRRPVNPEHAASTDDLVGFADGYPFLVTSASSLAALQAEMDEDVPMARFRPNIVLAGAEPWAEDDWRELRIDDTTFDVVAACTRCKITTTDQLTGERFHEPLRTLGRLRRTDRGVTFGVYAIPRSIDGELRVEDQVELVR